MKVSSIFVGQTTTNTQYNRPNVMYSTLFNEIEVFIPQNAWGIPLKSSMNIEL